jgi:hypothetical protein
MGGAENRGTASALTILYDDRKHILACRFQTKRGLSMTMNRHYRLAKSIQGEHRIAFERRRFSYTGFIPERRSGEDRRDDVSLVHTSAPSAGLPDRY